MKAVVLLCLAAVALAAPPRSDVEGLKEYLKKVRTIDDGKTLEEAMAERPWANAWENSGKHQGDILLTDKEAEELLDVYSGNSTKRTGAIQIWNRWPLNTLIYEFAPGHFTAAQQAYIESAFNFFHTHTCIRFRKRQNYEPQFVRVTSYSDGCYAHVGHWPGFGAHSLNLAWPGCSHIMIVIHEWLHAIGFNHMHQAYTRDQFVQINWQNVQQGMSFNFDLMSNNEVTMLGIPYEYASNQHYDRWAFSWNNQPTIVPRFNDFGQMGQLEFVTVNDVLRVNRLYNCPGAWDIPARAAEANTPLYTVEEHERYLREQHAEKPAQ